MFHKAVWNIRENIAPAGIVGTYLFTFDVSLPMKNYYEIIPKLRQRLGNKVNLVFGFGHIGKFRFTRMPHKRDYFGTE